MTTVLADARLGVVVADSSISDGDRQWRGRKVFRVGGDIVAFSGAVDEGMMFVDWLRKGAQAAKKPKLSSGRFQGLVLNTHGLFSFQYDLLLPVPVECGFEAIGSGGKAAMCAYEALGFTDPKRAVQIVCKHDAGSRAPVRVYHLKKHEPT